MGPSGSGKTSLLRAMAGLWRSGKGRITFYLNPQDDLTLESQENSVKRRSSGDVLFLPQRPYMVLGSLRQQLLYPAWSTTMEATPGGSKIDGTPFQNCETSYISPLASKFQFRQASYFKPINN